MNNKTLLICGILIAIIFFVIVACAIKSSMQSYLEPLSCKYKNTQYQCTEDCDSDCAEEYGVEHNEPTTKLIFE